MGMSTLRAFIERLRERRTERSQRLPADLTREQLAGLMRASWASAPRYLQTQPRLPLKARATWHRAMRIYLGQHQGWFATVTPATATEPRSSSRAGSLRQSA